MRLTYDPEANALYVYFSEIGIGGVGETLPSLVTEFDFDMHDQITAMRVFEEDEDGERCSFRDKLGFIKSEPNAQYGDDRIEVLFVNDPERCKTVAWDSNVDLDHNGQIVGIEILMVDPAYNPNDGIERLYDGGLAHILKFRVPFRFSF